MVSLNRISLSNLNNTITNIGNSIIICLNVPENSGFGNGYGKGFGFGYGDGYGYGTGNGFGNGFGDGYDKGSGFGDGGGFGSSDGTGHGSGYSSGYGSIDGSGHDKGHGYGDANKCYKLFLKFISTNKKFIKGEVYQLYTLNSFDKEATYYGQGTGKELVLGFSEVEELVKSKQFIKL